MGKPYDISPEDLLANRTSLVHVYLMFVDYRTKRFKYNVLFIIAMHIYFILYLLAANHLMN